MKKPDADVIIVGSGVGGATLAKELAQKGRKVLIVERGFLFALNQIGTEIAGYQFYDKHGLWSKTKEGVFYYRTIMVGGTSIVSCANGVRTLEKELKNLDIDLNKEFLEAEKELGIKPVPDKFIAKGSRKIMEAANRLGLKMVPMPKCINFEKCTSCGNCILGCRAGAKWTALEYLKEAQDKGASLLTDMEVTEALISHGKAVGVTGHNLRSEKKELFANLVVLSAGGIGTPIILQNSGINAGRKLFLDLFTVVLGLTKDTGLLKEPAMATLSKQEGFILSPFIDTPFVLVSVLPAALRKSLKIWQRERMLGIMVKIKDDCVGKVHKNGLIEKTVTKNDLAKLEKGTNLAKEILINAGADSDTITSTKIRGAHPGGTAAIGEVVDKNLQTKIKRLYVCDASVFPESPGAPPIVTIIALGKRLGKFLQANY